jgi:1-acyl-sn-glycerol-3-phosphate acyltransferase
MAPQWPAGAAGVPLPRRSPWLIRLFRHYVLRYLPRHFRAVRLSWHGNAPRLPDGPVAVVLNHPSWWDPLICLVLSGLFPGRRHYAPIDAAALKRYRFFGRLGFFGVERGRFRGARDFLRIGRAILDQPDSILWVTAQGRFADARDRPVRLAPGLGHLLERAGGGTVVPLAMELVFWDERLPEALAYFGEPVAVEGGVSSAECTVLLERALEAAQDALAAQTRRRDQAEFRTLLGKDGRVRPEPDGGRRAGWSSAERPARTRPPSKNPPGGEARQEGRSA